MSNLSQFFNCGGSGGEGGSISKSQKFTSSGTFTVPAGVEWIDVLLVGGGGGGAGACQLQTRVIGGGGGGGGECKMTRLKVTPSTSYNIDIGAGGAGGAACIGAVDCISGNLAGVCTDGVGGIGGDSKVRIGDTTLMFSQGGTGGFALYVNYNSGLSYGGDGGGGDGLDDRGGSINYTHYDQKYGGNGGRASLQGDELTNLTSPTYGIASGGGGGSAGHVYNGSGVAGSCSSPFAYDGRGGSYCVTINGVIGGPGGAGGGSYGRGADAVDTAPSANTANTGSGGAGGGGYFGTSLFDGGAGGSGYCVVYWHECGDDISVQVSGCGIKSIQRGVFTAYKGSTNIANFSAVNMSKTIVHISGALAEGHVMGYLNSSTSIIVFVYSIESTASAHVAWQVIEYY